MILDCLKSGRRPFLRRAAITWHEQLGTSVWSVGQSAVDAAAIRMGRQLGDVPILHPIQRHRRPGAVMYRSTEYKRLQSEQRQQPQQQGEAMAVAADGGRTSDAMMPQQQISTEEIVRRGEEIYERDLKARYDTPENRGKFLVIDVFSGDYEIAEDDLSATEPILERHPSALTFGIRIGYDAAYDMFAAHGARGA